MYPRSITDFHQLAPAAAAVHVLVLGICFKPLLRLQAESPDAQNHGLLMLEDMQHRCKLHELLACGCCTGCMHQRDDDTECMFLPW